MKVFTFGNWWCWLRVASRFSFTETSFSSFFKTRRAAANTKQTRTLFLANYSALSTSPKSHRLEKQLDIVIAIDSSEQTSFNFHTKTKWPPELLLRRLWKICTGLGVNSIRIQVLDMSVCLRSTIPPELLELGGPAASSTASSAMAKMSV